MVEAPPPLQGVYAGGYRAEDRRGVVFRSTGEQACTGCTGCGRAILSGTLFVLIGRARECVRCRRVRRYARQGQGAESKGR